MAVTREAPTDRLDDNARAEPLTQKPKPTRQEQTIQSRRERAGLGILQGLGWVAGLLGRFRILPVLPEDVAAITVHSPPIAKAAADIAAEDAAFAAVFDKLIAVGPYGALFESTLPLILQLVANHNKGVRDGTVDPAQFGATHPTMLLQMVGLAPTQSENGRRDADAGGPS